MKKTGFSLMEMMIVLLIMSIIAAATAPIVSKKMSKSASSSNASPWVFIDTKGNAAFNMAGKDVTAVIGASKVPDNVKTRLYIDCGSSSDSQLTFGSGDEVMQVTADPAGRVGISSANIPSNSVAFGGNQALSGTGSVAIGQGSQANGTYATAIGAGAKAGESAIAMSNSNASGKFAIALGDSSTATKTNSIAIGRCDATEEGAVALGLSAAASGKYSTALGYKTEAGNHSIAAGYQAKASSSGVALGRNAEATNTRTVAIGGVDDGSGATPTKASGIYATALGTAAQATNTHSIAIGANTKSTHARATVIGQGAVSTNSNQIVLGTGSDTVYIPGNLIAGGNVVLAHNWSSRVYMREGESDRNFHMFSRTDGEKFRGASGRSTLNIGGFSFSGYIVPNCDRRLKNVGAKYTDGLDTLKKLEFYHFTFKKDENKTPHVGVMAQDLQKVFPNAVTKSEDGYLRIRMEDMFYAVINAVKELDKRMNQQNEAQTQLINAQQKKIEELEKRLAEIENKK